MSVGARRRRTTAIARKETAATAKVGGTDTHARPEKGQAYGEIAIGVGDRSGTWRRGMKVVRRKKRRRSGPGRRRDGRHMRDGFIVDDVVGPVSLRT